MTLTIRSDITETMTHILVKLTQKEFGAKLVLLSKGRLQIYVI